MKNPVTPAGIEPATFRFVAQRLNHCTTAVPPLNGSSELKFVSELRFCRYLRLIGRLSSERCICAWIAFTFENTDLNVLRI